jgi:hypothetical protein
MIWEKMKKFVWGEVRKPGKSESREVKGIVEGKSIPC